MAATKAPKKPAAAKSLRDEWLTRLDKLVRSVRQWAEEFGWATRRIDKNLEDSQLGTYQAPALLMQKEFARVLLEPIARFAPGAPALF